MTEIVLPAELVAFLDNDPEDDGAILAYQDLYVEEPVLGKATSKFVGEGRVYFNSVFAYETTPENMHPMYYQQRGGGDVDLATLKFRFSLDPLRPGRSYSSVTVRIRLDPRPQVLKLFPDMKTTDTELEKTSGNEFALEVARAIQLHLRETHGKTLRRTEHAPVVTAFDWNEEGFAWRFEAQEGAPLFAQQFITTAILQVPRGTKSLNGVFESEAMTKYQVLSKSVMRRAAPAGDSSAFSVDLTRPSLRGPS